MRMREFIKSMIVLWRAPAEAKKKAEDEMTARLSELPEQLREKANQSRGKKEWKIVLAAKVNSILANEKRLQSEHDLDRLNKSGADAAEIMKASLIAAHAGTEAILSDGIFQAEWTGFTASL